MNSVHEPGPNGDSKILSSRKPIRKTKSDAQAPIKPNRHARPYRGQAWPCRGRGPLPYRSPCRRVAALLSRPCAPCRERLAPRPCAPCPARVTGLHGRIVSAQAAVSWAPADRVAGDPAVSQRSARARLAPTPSARAPYARLHAQPSQLPSHNTIFCIAAKNQPNQAPQSQYKKCIAIHFLLSPSTTCYNTRPNITIQSSP